jgi:hypothetical protein
MALAAMVADAVDGAVFVGVTAANGTGIANYFNNQPGWTKDSIMEITFGIMGTMLGVAAVWYRELAPLFSRVVGWEMVRGRGVWIPTSLAWLLWLVANDRWVLQSAALILVQQGV